uniref:Iron-containing redox enzyme n=1 Tax=Candidatus Kentrum sp. DK TaxID=2126562 RepID=A0A450SEX5_9GAMM|nr:MAG: Iron-containing redox enzyme [Candidatus Kentron sp. DK]VFJ67418.1 MAG: Iron-containing redox enzyme [Candidatus Kentron sp. DK]
MSNEKYDALVNKHSWILEPIENAVSKIGEMEFFRYLTSVDDIGQLKPIVRQLFHHSVSFPKSIGLRLASTPIEKGFLYPAFAAHAHDEANHHLLLFNWMSENNLIGSVEELFKEGANTETNACIDLGYQMAAEEDYEQWILSVNCSIERCFLLLFEIMNKKTNDLGFGHEYFSVHVEADNEHIFYGLEFVDKQSSESERGQFLLKKSFESMAVWTTMVHSWLNIDVKPVFAPDGNMISF